MERQYPPFGHVPSLIAGDHELRVSGRALGVLSGVFAQSTGILAHLWTATIDAELSGATYAFERLAGSPAPADLQIVAQIDDSTEAVPASLVAGGGGRDETGADARAFLLWFPLDPAGVLASVRLTLSWPAAGWEASLKLSSDVIRAAVARSGELAQLR